MEPGGSERRTNRQSGRSILASGRPERVAQVRTRRTAPPDQPAADPSSLPVSRLRDPMNQRTSCASTGEFFNTIPLKAEVKRGRALKAAEFPRRNRTTQVWFRL